MEAMETRIARSRGTDSAKVIQVIETKSTIGLGTENDMVRVVTKYWDFEGNLLAENDPTITIDSQAIGQTVRTALL